MGCRVSAARTRIDIAAAPQQPTAAAHSSAVPLGNTGTASQLAVSPSKERSHYTLECSHLTPRSPSWPSRSRCRVSVVTRPKLPPELSADRSPTATGNDHTKTAPAGEPPARAGRLGLRRRGTSRPGCGCGQTRAAAAGRPGLRLRADPGCGCGQTRAAAAGRLGLRLRADPGNV